jgi:cystathionine beta-lyase
MNEHGGNEHGGIEVDLAQLRTRTSAKWTYFPEDVLPAWVAEMDFSLAPPVAQALTAAIARSDTGYRSTGRLPEALANFCALQWNWSPDPAHMMVLADVMTGIATTLRFCTQPADFVVINSPVYPPFYSTVRDVAGRNIYDVPLVPDEQGRYGWDLVALDVAFARPEVTAYVLCSPHNPVGSVPTAHELAAIARSAAEHGVFVIADEIHAPLTLAGSLHTPYLCVGGADARAVSVVSASKAWNIAGLKCAQLIASPAVAEELFASVPLETQYGAGHLGVIASIAAFEDGEPWRQEMLGVLDGNRYLFGEKLSDALPAAAYRPPDASYLTWVDLSAYELGDDPALPLLEVGRVAVNSGPTFGAGGAGHIRVNIGTSAKIIDEIVARIARGTIGSQDAS